MKPHKLLLVVGLCTLVVLLAPPIRALSWINGPAR